MKQSAREELPAAAPAHQHATAAVLPKRRPGPPPPAFSAGGNAAIHRLVSGGAPVAARKALLPQAKLTVSRPSDPLEREADAVAARVSAGPGTFAPSAGPLTAARAPAAAGESIPAVPMSVEFLIRDPGAGEQLPPDVRERIEAHLGVSLGGVQVHGHAAARDAAAQLNARAFTFGPHIFLGPGESASDVALMAHEATHVVQQGAVNVYRDMLHRSSDSILPDFIVDAVRSYARDLPGYDMLTVVAGYDPIDDRAVPRTPQNLVRGVIGLVPFGNQIAERLIQMEIVQDAFTMVDQGLAANNLTLARISSDIDRAWDELALVNGIDGNLAIISRYVDGIYQDALRFARSLLDAVLQMIRDAAVGLAETYLEGTPSWALAKKVMHHDPLRGTPVAATTVEILTDLLVLIGKPDVLAQMQERGTLQKTADWIDTQIGRFASLVGELGALFEAGWAAIQPANIANLPENLQKLAQDAIGFVQRVVAFGSDVLVAILRIIKDSLLGWLSGEAHKMHGFRMLTVILGQNPFTHEAVPRNAANLIGGFISLLPGGEAIYAQFAETGVIADAAGRIEAAMTRLGISVDMITNTFLGVWNSLSLEDLLNPIGAFLRVLEKFGEPLGRIVDFVTEVMKVVVELVLRLMNFPSDLIGSIVSNAMQSIDDIQRDPVGFLVNMLQALKAGLSGFFDHVLGYLLDGLSAWLFRGLGELGISKPKDYSLESILDLVLQVLGVTAEKLWEKLGQQIGPENVAKIRGGIDTLTGVWSFVKDVQEGGVAAIWKHVESQLAGLWDTLISMAKDWIVTEIVEKVTAKLLSMLDPTGIMAVVNSMIAFFKAIQSAIEYLRDILQIVNEYVMTFAAIAAGSIAPGAAKIERGLANAIPVAIGFLANQVGLGNVPEKVVEIIQGLRAMIDEALTWLFEQAMRLGRAAMTALGVGGKDETPPPAAAEAPAAVTAGQIPAGLPPDEIKRLVLDMLQESLSGHKAASVGIVQAQVAAVMQANRDRGLHGIEVSVPDKTTMDVLVEASASPALGRRIAWADIFPASEVNANEELEELREALSRAGMESYAAVAVDGAQIGEMSRSGGGSHAEEALVRGKSWTDAIARVRERIQATGSARLTLMINRSPCMHCVSWLKGAIAEAKEALGADYSKAVFMLTATGTYRRQARLTKEDREALREGVERMAKRTGRPFDVVYREQEEIWKEDMRSESTEYVDDDGTVYSGLAELSGEGWQIAGLDAGQKVTLRQIEFAEIAERLASSVAVKV